MNTVEIISFDQLLLKTNGFSKVYQIMLKCFHSWNLTGTDSSFLRLIFCIPLKSSSHIANKNCICVFILPVLKNILLYFLLNCHFLELQGNVVTIQRQALNNYWLKENEQREVHSLVMLKEKLSPYIQKSLIFF